MQNLKGSHRKYLRSQAHHLKPVVHIGKAGVTEGLVQNIQQALDTHELVKMKFVEHKEERHDLSDQIAKKTGSHIVGLIGNIGIFYRRHPDAEKRKIQLPQ